MINNVIHETSRVSYNKCVFNKNFKKAPTEKQRVGELGETRACEHLMKLGYKVVERNYLKKWGEIDIVARKGNKLHFIEVKSVSRDLSHNVTYVTNFQKHDSYRAEDNIHPWKLQRLSRTIQSYLIDRDVPENIDWQFDIVTVHLDQKTGEFRIEKLEDVII